jgi:hypothetical protein
MLTPKEYTFNGGLRCPTCGGDNLQTTGFFKSRDNMKVENHVWCEDCGSHWDDIYRLDGYENLMKLEAVNSL